MRTATLGRGSITKLGKGTLVLTGANTYAGTTAVEKARCTSMR